MSLEVIETVQEGFTDTFSRTGLIIGVASYIFTMLSTVSTQSLMADFIGSFAGSSFAAKQSMALALGGPAALWALVGLVTWIGTSVVSVGAIRSFVNGETGQINQDYFRRNMVMAVLNLAIGGLLYAIAVGIGLILLIVPGIFIAVSLIFWQIYVAEEDQNFVEAFSNSWDLTSGNRLELAALGFAVLLVGMAVGFVTGIPSTLGILNPSIGAVISNIGNAFTTVFTLATLASAYRQLQ